MQPPPGVPSGFASNPGVNTAVIDGGLPSDVVLEVPATPTALRVVRMVAATVASDDGFDVDDVDDVRMAVDELCASLIEAHPASSLSVRFRVTEHELLVTANAERPPAAPAPTIDELRGAVLGAVTSGYGIDVDGDRFVGWFSKRAAIAKALSERA
jgi:serine/threonine-protein kinase RsbW